VSIEILIAMYLDVQHNLLFLIMKGMNTNVNTLGSKTSIGGKAMEMSVKTSRPRQE
jgi:hypothetical protein